MGKRRPIRWFTDPIAEILMRFFNGPYPVDVSSYLKSREDYEGQVADHHVKHYSDSIENFRKEFAKGTVRYGTVLLLTIVMLGFSVPWQIVGISLNVIGAIILARGLLSGPITITVQSSGAWGGTNPELRDAMIQDAIDGTWGVFLLLSGVIFQAVAILS